MFRSMFRTLHVTEFSQNQRYGFDILLDINSQTHDLNAIFHVHGSFGDIYLQLSVLRELANSNVPFAVLIDPKYKSLVEVAFEGSRSEIRIIYINSHALNNILNQKVILGFSRRLPTRLLPTVYPSIPELILNGSLFYADFLRTMVLQECPQGRPFPVLEKEEQVTQCQSILSQNMLRPGRTVLISPHNNTQMPIPSAILSEIVTLCIEYDWDVCVNSADATSIDSDKFSNLPQVKVLAVPPHCPVSFVTACGLYVSGNNGFSTIQALFNHRTVGLHLINAFAAEGGRLKDKAGNLLWLDRFPHAKTFPNQFLQLQIEHFIATENNFDCGRSRLIALLKKT